MTLGLVIASQKGGVGKSTVALNLALTLAEIGYDTVLVDTDPQSAVNLNLGKGESQFQGLAQVIMGQVTVEETLLPTNHPRLRLLPKGRLAIHAVPAFELRLYHDRIPEKIIETPCLKDSIVIFDTPAGMGMITRAALRAGSHVLTPFRPDHLNLRSMNQLMETLAYIQAEENPNLQFLGFILNMFDKKRNAHQRVVTKLWCDIPLVLDTVLPHSELFEVAQDKKLPVVLMGPSPEARRFRQLAEEILERVGGREVSHEIRQLV